MSPRLSGLDEHLPTWDVTDVHESVDARSYGDALERVAAEVDRLVARFDADGIRATETRRPDADDGAAADRALAGLNRVSAELTILRVYATSFVSTDSRNAAAQSALGETRRIDATLRPLTSRLADWVAALGVDPLAEVSPQVAEHRGPLLRLAARAAHQMTEAEEHLAAELSVTGSAAWSRLQNDVTSQLTTVVELPDGEAELPMPAVRGLATDPDRGVRRAAYDAELRAWPTVEVPVAAAMNAIKGEADALNRRRRWPSPLDASLFANSVSRATFDAMHAAVVASLPDLRRWMRAKAALHAALEPGPHDEAGGLAWWDLVAPLPLGTGAVSWDEGVDVVRTAFAGYSDRLGRLVDRALDERWIDAAPRPGKSGGAFCAPFVGDRSLVLLNWSGSADSTQTTAHELGHAYHNTTLAGRTALQRQLPMALAETASIFCETLVVEAGLARLSGVERLAQLDVDLVGTNQIIVDIHSRFVFETEVFARRRRRTLGPAELCEMMTDAQATAYGDGLDHHTAHPYMWLLKPHYYGSHFYNWPYTYGLLFGLGLFARFQDDPERFRAGYDDLLSRAGMDTAEELGAAFGLDVTDQAFWTASLDVVRSRIDNYLALAPLATEGPRP
jgi:pepF/M3 family oligoendopeptidase